MNLIDIFSLNVVQLNRSGTISRNGYEFIEPCLLFLWPLNGSSKTNTTRPSFGSRDGLASLQRSRTYGLPETFSSLRTSHSTNDSLSETSSKMSFVSSTPSFRLKMWSHNWACEDANCNLRSLGHGPLCSFVSTATTEDGSTKAGRAMSMGAEPAVTGNGHGCGPPIWPLAGTHVLSVAWPGLHLGALSACAAPTARHEDWVLFFPIGFVLKGGLPIEVLMRPGFMGFGSLIIQRCTSL